MDKASLLLDRIEEGIIAHGGDLGGWTRRHDDTLQLFDGRVILRADLPEPQNSAPQGASVHAHLLAQLIDYDDAVLDACIYGIGDDDNAAVNEAAMIWILAVAGPIKSLLDDKPVCQTCQANSPHADPSAGYEPGGYGLPTCKAFVGPGMARFVEENSLLSPPNSAAPWFQFAAESVGPARVHLAKVLVTYNGASGYKRDLEIDGHEVTCHEEQWQATPAPKHGFMSRFAVFEFPGGEEERRRRAELERTILAFAERYAAAESIDEMIKEMIAEGFDATLVHEVEMFSTCAFGRMVFEPVGMRYPPNVIRIRGDGRIEADVPLMSLPAYTRARALTPRLRERLSQDAFQKLCMYHAESNAINNALWQEMKLEDLNLLPCLSSDPDAPREAVERACAMLQQRLDQESAAAKAKKPWWKFW